MNATESVASLDDSTVVDGFCRNIQTDLELRSRNTSSLLRIQEMMNSMEGEVLTLDEVLERVLGFFRRFVPFN